MNGPLRHHCRYQPCRLKLAEPVDNIRRAFCSPGCHASFYKRRCLVCEREFVPKARGAPQRLCKSAKCRAEYRRFPHAYTFDQASVAPTTGIAEKSRKTPIKPGSFWRDKEGRGWRWQQYGEEHWLFNRDGDVQARVVPVGDRHIVRLTPGIDYGVPSPLDDAKRLAISLALARLPLEPKYAERLARINELPPDPPQSLLPWTASYLAGLADVESEAPSIVPDLPSDGGDLEIPLFLQRSTMPAVSAHF
jgi:hypothetical protein